MPKWSRLPKLDEFTSDVVSVPLFWAQTQQRGAAGCEQCWEQRIIVWKSADTKFVHHTHHLLIKVAQPDQRKR